VIVVNETYGTRTLLGAVVVARLGKFTASLEPESLLSSSQEPATMPNPEAE